MNIFLVNQDNPYFKSLVEKLSDRKEDGRIIPLSQGEMDLYNSEDFKHVYIGESPSKFIELEPQKS